jgi:hypothetical protein
MTGDLIQRRDRAYRGASRMLTGHGRRIHRRPVMPHPGTGQIVTRHANA